MHLKRVELLGFKSFASKSVLELERGITGIVGPNGSGKSNVADAVRWALGEQSLRAVRSRKSDEVIFAGNARRPAVGMAEVTLVFDNAEGMFPLPFAEVSITRRQYRSGEGEYLINRARARLKDVVELLTHARLGPDGYAIVGQGAVDEVLLQRPEERRMLLEAASDISRYQMKLKESLDKLAETEANIRRVEDIRNELTPQLNRLRQQAHRAQRYEQVVRKLKELIQWRYLLQVREARERAIREMEKEQGKVQAFEGATRAHEALQRRVAELREGLRASETELEAARERLVGLRLAKATAEREAALFQEREAAYSRQLKEAEDELARASNEQADLQAQMEQLGALRSSATERLVALRTELEPLEKESQRATAEQRMIQAQLDRVASERQGLQARRSELQERRNGLARELFKAEQLRKESLEASSKAAAQLSNLEMELAAAQESIDKLRRELAEVEARHKDMRARHVALSAELETARRLERKAWEEDRDLQSRMSILRSFKERHQGLAGGAKAILQSKLEGIHGTLASMIVVPREYVSAIAAALSEAQGYVVSEDSRNAFDALLFLADRKEAATVTPRRLDGGEGFSKLAEEFRSSLDTLVRGVAFVGVASELVSCSKELEGLCVRYLGFSLVVESMSDALEVYRRLTASHMGRWPFQVVTLDGHVLRARGDMARPQAGGEDGGLLAIESELTFLPRKAEEVRSRLQQARDTVAALDSAIAEIDKQVQADVGSISRLQAEIGKRTATQAELATRIGKLEASIEWHRSRISAAELEASQSRDKLAKAEEDLAVLSSKESEAAGRTEQLMDDLAAQNASVTEVAGKLSRLQTEVSAVQNRLREIDARIAAVSEGLQRAEGRVGRQRERVDQLSKVMAQLALEPKAVFPASLLKDLEEAERSVGEYSALINRQRGELSAAERELAEVAKLMEAARGELTEVRSKVQRASIELVALVREAARESGVEMEGVEPDAASETVEYAYRLAEKLRDILIDIPTDTLPATIEEASRKVDALRREVQGIGTINADAPEEYRQLSERNNFLTSQLDDLRRGERTLRKAIEELKAIMEQRFKESFDRVNSEFGRCFSTLFDGGSARLALTQPEQPLQGGVEILVNLPGKKSGSLLGLSGGERALTAIALLFALMRVNPSPFCLLDEVDAALDESNVRRFCNLLKELKASTQFLVITHNRTTMEMASALHGVSMNADSTSRLMSLRLASKESEN